jgi:TetR/AcrR family transcriptional regulator, transcriptional repressor for nem operon
MNRTRAFDSDNFLVKAMNLFWRNGYFNTSMRDIVLETDVHPGSLYSIYGSKEFLYQQVLMKYSCSLFHKSLPKDLPPLVRIELWFQNLVDELSSDKCQRGCLLVNTMSEAGLHSSATMSMVEAELNEIETFFRTSFQEVLRNDDVALDINCDTSAKCLLSTVVGMLMISKIKSDRSFFVSTINVSLLSTGIVIK